MQNNIADVLPTAEALTDAFLLNFPRKAAFRLIALPVNAAGELLERQPRHVVAALFKHLPPGAADQYLEQMSDPAVLKLLEILPPHDAADLLLRQQGENREALLVKIKQTVPHIASELEELMAYPDNAVGRIMDPQVQAIHEELTIGEAIKQLRGRNLSTLETLFIVNNDMQLIADVDIAQLVLANRNRAIATIARPVQLVLNALDLKDDALESFSGRAIPVVDAHNRLIGAISASIINQQTREELAADVQTMVGASKDERAMSSSWFAVKSVCRGCK